MKRLAALLAIVLLSLTPGQWDSRAQPPPPEDAAIVRAWLFKALETAPTEGIGTVIADQIWRFWMGQAPDPASATLMAQAMSRREQSDFAGAMQALDELVKRAPGWSEAWNQRATVLFFQEKFDESLEDVEKVLALEPKHFGALAGKAVILMQQGRPEPGHRALRQAVRIHPWLKERGMLPPEPPGQKL